MTQSVALLRGINVGRAKRISMADLRTLFESLGHTNVRTLLNSGNVVFQSRAGSAASHASLIERDVSDRLSLAVRAVVVPAGELHAIVASNPLPQATSDPSKFLVAFVQRSQSLVAARALMARSWEPEAIAIGTKAAYLWCAGGIIESKIAKAFSRATGEAATTRNWATVLKLQAMLTEGDSRSGKRGHA